MECPNVECDHVPGERYKAPRDVPGLGVVRRHRCPNCRRVFMSLQKVISNWAAEKILLRLEDEDARLNARLTESSAPQPGTIPESGTSQPAS
jgi:hypothetical protein